MAGSQVRRPKARDRRYPINQCRLYKVTTKARLAEILFTSLPSLRSLAVNASNYSVFEKPEEVCPFIGKRTKARWVQEPLGQLKIVQARITKLLSHVELPEYCHGATKFRSYRSNAEVHQGSDYVATFDIKTFFPSTSQSRVYNFFRDELLCAPDVAELLAALCTSNNALPTGAPSSPILSFFANLQLFDDLYTVAKAKGLKFSVYIDDLTYSGAELPGKFQASITQIVLAHGHRLAVHKSRTYGPDAVKHVTGVVLHEGVLKVPHARFHKARAIEASKNASSDPRHKVQLSRRLSGLLGEAAFLDDSFAKWASRSYQDLAALTSSLRAQGIEMPQKSHRRNTVRKPQAAAPRMPNSQTKVAAAKP